MRTPSWSPLALLLVSSVFAHACSGDTAVVVRVSAKPGVHDGAGGSPSSLLVTFQSSSDALKQEHVFTPVGGRPFYQETNSTTFSIIANGRVGPASITAEARAVDTRPLGRGATTAIMKEGTVVEYPLTIFPTDFVVNTNYGGSQDFSYGPSGRQLAAGADGSFVVTWKTWPCTPYDLNRTDDCPIFGRLFDATAVPRLSAQGTSEEFTLTPGGHGYGSPAVAMKPKGGFALAWLRKDGQGNMGIYSRAFTADGGADSTQGVSESKLSDDGAEFYAYPHLAVTPTGYVVSWLEATATDYSVKARLLTLTANPQPQTSVVDVHTMPKAKWITASPGEHWLSRVWSSIAADQQGGFFVVFHETCAAANTVADCWDLKGRMYDHTGKPKTAVQHIESTPLTRTGALTVSALPYGFIVMWSSQISAISGHDVRARRFRSDGAGLEEEWTVNSSVGGNQQATSIAALPDGSLLAVWFTDDESQDPAGGLRGRILLSNGLPVGGDFQVNSTQTGLQVAPSVTPVGAEAFAVAFVDGSKSPPDTQVSAIRARLLYPNYDPRDGQLGALCTPGQCAAGLLCAPLEIPGRPTQQRCINECVGPGAPCPNGGTCKESPDASAPVCYYDVR